MLSPIPFHDQQASPQRVGPLFAPGALSLHPGHFSVFPLGRAKQPQRYPDSSVHEVIRDHPPSGWTGCSPRFIWAISFWRFPPPCI